MRSRLKWFIWLCLPVLIAAGLQGFYWYQVKRSVDNLIAIINPLANVSYEYVSAWAFQDVSLAKVRVRLASGNPLLSAEQLTIGSTSWLELLSLDSVLSSGDVSSSIFVSLHRLQISPESLHALNAPLGEAEGVQPLSTLLCPEQAPFGQTPLEVLGYDKIRGDATFRVDPSPKNSALHLFLKADFSQLASAEVDLLIGQKGGVSLRREQLANSVIQQMKVSLRDQGLNVRWRDRCTDQASIELPDYGAMYKDALNAWWAFYGINVSDNVLQSMAAIWTPNIATQLRFEPASPPSLLKLAVIDNVEDVFSRAEVRLAVGDDLVEFSDDEWSVILQLYAGDVRSAARAMVTPDAVTKESESLDSTRLREIVPGVMPIRPPEKIKRYQLTPFPELSEYVGSSIKVQTLFGREMDGVLVSTNNTGISIRRHIQQGKATIPVLRENISAVRVYR